MRREDVAVFYRTNAMSRVLEDTLVRFELPYQVIGGTKFYERAEIKDAVAYLSLLVNPSDQVSFAPYRQLAAPGDRQHEFRAGSSPTRTRPAGRSGRSSSRSRTCREWALRRSRRCRAFTRWSRASPNGPGRRARGRDPRGDAPRERLPGSPRGRAPIEAEGRAENLEELIGVAAEFDANHELEGDGGVTPLEEFLQQISLYTEQDGLRDEESLITLMTLHNAKGLEYDTVFIVGCEEGSFPHARALEEGGEEEERRLCYVGITRARRRLYMTWARERRLFGRAERNLPSRFVDELPPELTERHSTRRARRQAGTRLRPPPRRRSTPGRRWSCRPGTTSSTRASATAS